MSAHTEHASIAAAFVAAQAEFTHVIATRQGQARGGHFSYADLSDLIEMAKPVLQRHGLGYRTVNGRVPGGVTAETVLIHAATGEELSNGDTFIGVPDEAGGQAFGSAYTYARRYSFLAALGVAADDDDGLAAMQAQTARAERAARLHHSIGEREVGILCAIGKACNANTSDDRLRARYSDILEDDFQNTLQAGLGVAVKQKAITAAQADAIADAVTAGATADEVRELLAGEAVAA